MTEEMNEQCKCFCKTEAFKRFVIVTLGTFVGGFCALSLFVALNKPPMPCPMMGGQMPPFEHQQRGHFDKAQRADFDMSKPPVERQQKGLEQPPMAKDMR